MQLGFAPGVLVLFSACTCPSFGQSATATAVPMLPVPSGPHAIGRVGYDWVDASRPDPHSKEPNAHRELMVYVWYPAPGKPGAHGSYVPDAQAMERNPDAQAAMRSKYGANWPPIVSGAIFSHAVDRAPVIPSPTRLPLVIFSHGLGSTGFEYTCLIEDLVSWGYVVASIEHTGTAVVTWFPDGRVGPRQRDAQPPGLSAGERYQWMVARASEMISEGAADVRFVLDRITAANADPEHFHLAGRLDLDRVAAMGHSAGAEFAARACQLDDRVKACVDLDGGMVPVGALPEYPDRAPQKQPLLFLEAYHPDSGMAGSPAEHAAYFKKKEEQLRNLPRGSYAVTLHSTGIAHPSFSDTPLLFAGQDGYPPTPTVLHNLTLIESYVRDFLGKTLQQKKAPLLDGATAATPEAVIERYQR